MEFSPAEPGGDAIKWDGQSHGHRNRIMKQTTVFGNRRGDYGSQAGRQFGIHHESRRNKRLNDEFYESNDDTGGVVKRYMILWWSCFCFSPMIASLKMEIYFREVGSYVMNTDARKVLMKYFDPLYLLDVQTASTLRWINSCCLLWKNYKFVFRLFEKQTPVELIFFSFTIAS